jgi:integrase
MKHSAREFETAKPRARAFKIFDENGLFMLVRPDGRKQWRFRYRSADGREKLIVLGDFPVVSLKDARGLVFQNRKLLQEKVDPSEKRKEEKAIARAASFNTFGAVADKWFETRKVEWCEGHAKRVRSSLENDVFPYLEKRPIAGVSAQDYLAVCERIQDSGAIETAHRVLGYCRQIVDFAVTLGWMASNPVYSIGRNLKKTRGGHFAAVTNSARLAGILRSIDGYQGSQVVRCALRIVPYVFVRPGELRNARWADVDLDRALWTYTATKTGTPHIVPLSRQIVKILREDLKPRTFVDFREGGGLLFPSERSEDRAISDGTLNVALLNIGIPRDVMSVHGFRATARTILEEVLHFRPAWIEMQLAHAVKDMNGRAYNRTTFMSERVVMMQAWADYLDALKKGGKIDATLFSAEKRLGRKVLKEE